MKKIYYFILSILTTALMLLFALLEINKITTVVDLTPYQTYVDFATKYGCITLLCCFAFGGLIGKSIKIILGLVIILAILVIVAASFFPQFLQSIFNHETAETMIGLFKLMA